MTDDRRVPDPSPPMGTTIVEAPGIDGADVRTALSWVRTATAIAFGVGGACWLALAVVVALAAQHALEPERPLAAVSVVLSVPEVPEVPEVRAGLAADMVDDLEEDAATTFTSQEREELAAALERRARPLT